MTNRWWRPGLVVSLAAVVSCASSQERPRPGDEEAERALRTLADETVALALERDPTTAYGTGLPVPSHDRWPAVEPDALAGFRAREDRLHARLQGIDAGALASGQARVDHALLTELLGSSRQLRVCRHELWDLSHMSGWHRSLPTVAQAQPVDSPQRRAEALARWAGLPAHVEAQIDNLRRGLEAGYAAPAAVVRRVVAQVDAIASADGDASALWSPAARSDDPAFAAAYARLLAETVNPALRRFSRFLSVDYLPRARDGLAVSDLPDGAACYAAFLRYYTTLDRAPGQVHDIGADAVARNLDAVADLGERLFGERDAAAIAAHAKALPDNRFPSEQAFIDDTRAYVETTREASAPLFEEMPRQPLRAEPLPAYLRGTGGNAYYERGSAPDQPAYYRIDSEKWQTQTRSGAEIVAVHEGYPGHHMQVSYALSLPSSPVAKIAFNAAYAEGWGRYAEILAEEAGMYTTDLALIERRLWPARGMVADPGLHVLGWSRQRTVDYLAATGRLSPAEAADVVDRMAVWPGQLTAYDSGALEILALREEAQRALGERFDLRAFHRVVLQDGVVPLRLLRSNVEAWIAETQRDRP